MEFIQNITLEQVAAFLVFIGGLYGGAKYLKKELKEGIVSMLKEKFDGIDEKFKTEDNRIRALEDQSAFLFKAISLLLEDDIAILEHLRTNNNTGKMAKQEDEVHKFLTEIKADK
jgi:hypothetical protein